MIAAAEIRNAAADDAVRQHAARSDAQAAIVEKCAATTLGRVELVGRRIENHAGDDLVIALERDRDGKQRNAVQEIGGAVERIDDPAMRAVGALDLFTFLAEEAVGGACLHQLVADDLLRLQIRLADEIARSLHGNLQVLHFAEIAAERLSCLEGSLNHDIEKSRTGHRVSLDKADSADRARNQAPTGRERQRK